MALEFSLFRFPSVFLASVIAIAIIAGSCTDQRTVSPNEPGYNASGAPGKAAGYSSNGPRPCRALGDEQQSYWISLELLG